ncbi:MAG: hypothetical protein UH625_09320 [Muribaculaceae bacterium]|nr:hypothetical protein [Muribaculaceae bacterium]
MMNEIFTHIEFLLHRHDCVIVPDLGAFVIQHIPAEYVAESGLMLPPRKRVLFNPELTHTDGILASSISRKNKISYEQAVAFVTEQVAAIKNALAEPDASLNAGNIGSLTRQDHGAITLQPKSPFFASPSLYGLEPLHVTTVEQREQCLKPERKPVFRPINLIRVAASIILLVAIGFLTTTPIPAGETEMHLASLAIPEVTAPKPAQIHTPVEITLNIAIPADSLSPSLTISQTELNRKSCGAPFSDNHPYYLVVASLDNSRQAEAFVKAHPQQYLETVNLNGRTRVIAATGTSAQSLIEFHRSSLADIFPDAWPCHR